MNAAATDVQSMPLPAKDLTCAGCTLPSRTALRIRHREKGMPIDATGRMEISILDLTYPIVTVAPKFTCWLVH